MLLTPQRAEGACTSNTRSPRLIIIPLLDVYEHTFDEDVPLSEQPPSETGTARNRYCPTTDSAQTATPRRADPHHDDRDPEHDGVGGGERGVEAIDELQARVSELTDRIEAYRDEYGVDSPAEVDVLEFDAERIDDVYVELGDWGTIIEERRLHERARRKAAGSTAPSHS
ncbi:hypothetical protein [Natrialba asiatica]|uniref:hypothetical protein n=1 Tax=Natrialba asiatica TaxID=64602 RepID=UPI001F4C952A|nr:hypothetical protein [Natrialba asiatica]